MINVEVKREEKNSDAIEFCTEVLGWLIYHKQKQGKQEEEKFGCHTRRRGILSFTNIDFERWL